MKNAIYSQLINQYSVSKTLRFELIPQGKTLEYIEKRGLISVDEERQSIRCLRERFKEGVCR